MKLNDITFHCKARNGKEKVILTSESPQVLVSSYEDKRLAKIRISFAFYNCSEVLKKTCNVGFSRNRLYFTMADDGYKLTGEKVKIFSIFDDRFMKFVNIRPYILRYDDEVSLYYIEKSPVKSIICKS